MVKPSFWHHLFETFLKCIYTKTWWKLSLKIHPSKNYKYLCVKINATYRYLLVAYLFPWETSLWWFFNLFNICILWIGSSLICVNKFCIGEIVGNFGLCVWVLIIWLMHCFVPRNIEIVSFMISEMAYAAILFALVSIFYFFYPLLFP